ncbi:CdaR family protein [Thermotalea metallivorans]|uniref:CdaA regulatory protein CdaR n=1 Tax=Thermotalea metallivorans TaxID=520762 RepID=A0A140L3F9_9FIRM|nr:CdaR family protein [Thermotalea metallivorans]KXG75084.1 hypothetical protein AN619_19100 [Thermotalea metallivorans]
MNNFFKDFAEKSRFFRRNTTPKIVSIIFALVMWLYVMGEVNPEMIKELTNVRVQLLNVEELKKSGLVLIGQEDYTVNIKIGGRRNEVYHVGPQDIAVSADLRGFRKGVNSVPLDISVPASIKVLDVSPKQLKVTLDEIVKQQKPVEIEAVGIPSEEFDPGEAVLSLKEVIVEGPESLVNSVTKVVGEVNFQNRTEDFNGKILLKAVNQDGKIVNGVEVKTKFVEVTLPLYSVKNVKIALDLRGKPPETYQMTDVAVKPEVVGLKGPRELLKSIDEIKTKPIDIDGLTGSVEKAAELAIPEGVTLFKTDRQPVVVITIEEIGQKEFTFKKDEVFIENLDGKYRVFFDEGVDTLRVKVEAAKNILNSLTKNDIQLRINAKGLGEGRYSLKVIPVASRQMKSISVIPEKIDFELKLEKETNQP